MLTATEKALVQRLFTLVNLKKISDARKVERLAANIPGFTVKVQSYGGDVNQPRQLQATLRKALDDVLSSKRGPLNKVVVQTVNDQLQHVQAGFRLSADGDLMIISGLLGCDAIFGYAVALLVDRKRGVRDRLAKCGAPGCGRFVLTFGRGRPQRHCNVDHRRKADAIESRNRSQIKRDKVRAERLLRAEESIDYVRGALPNLKREEIERIAERVKARRYGLGVR